MGRAGTPIPVTGKYDIWRVQCRGPVPDTVLQQYGPFQDPQPDGKGGIRNVTVAESCVIWHSPYSGDLFTGPGSILENDTQVRLRNFVNSGENLNIRHKR